MAFSLTVVVGVTAGCSAPPTSGEGWRKIGGLDADQAMFQFVEIDEAHLTHRATYDEAVAALCSSGGSCQIAFFAPGDRVPPIGMERGEFFRQGGWRDYNELAYYWEDEFTKWDCERAGSTNAPRGATCGSTGQ